MKKILKSAIVAAVATTSLLADKVSAYEYAPLKSIEQTKSALTSNGFTVLGEYDAMQDPNHHVIVYTCKTLSGDASKEDRAFAAVQKVMVDKADNTLVLTNPEYFQRAFLQDDYKEDHGKRINKKLSATFGAMSGSKDGLDDDDIAGYHFMMGMPYYEDMITVAKGDDLAAKLEKNAGGNIVFKHQVGDATLYGVAMNGANGEKSYVSAIEGAKNGAFLPYMVMIQDGEAKILHAKYYLAISFPSLSMGQFMKISSTPGDIEDYFTSLFK